IAQAFDHVVRVSQTDLGRARQFVESPQVVGLYEQRAHDARGTGSKERLEGTGRRAKVGLAFLLDEDVVEIEEAVAREIEIAETVALDNRRSLGADVLGYRDRIGAVHLSTKLAQAGNSRADLTRLPHRSDFEEQGVFLCTKLEFH